MIKKTRRKILARLFVLQVMESWKLVRSAWIMKAKACDVCMSGHISERMHTRKERLGCNEKEGVKDYGKCEIGRRSERNGRESYRTTEHIENESLREPVNL